MSDRKTETIIYVGNFMFPNKNAAAQRVITIGKILRELGYSIVFVSFLYEQDKSIIEIKEYFGFKCYEYKISSIRADKIRYLLDFQYLKNIIEENKCVKGVIAYNFQTFLLYKLLQYCRNKKICCMGDITEWYGTDGLPYLKKIKEQLDICLRMRILYKRMDGNIVISDYLEKYYKNSCPVVNIPPLVDLKDSKWDNISIQKESKQYEIFKTLKLIYAGSPSKQKERLDMIIEAITKLKKQYFIELHIIGITKVEFLKIYEYSEMSIPENVFFYGKISHVEALKKVAEADYSILIRDKNRVTMAGFPTKFVESISVGTPVITNDNSCIKKYISYGENGFLVSVDDLERDLKKVFLSKNDLKVEKTLFDYRKYIELMKEFMNRL